jgi:hypothetical protein
MSPRCLHDVAIRAERQDDEAHHCHDDEREDDAADVTRVTEIDRPWSTDDDRRTTRPERIVFGALARTVGEAARR